MSDESSMLDLLQFYRMCQYDALVKLSVVPEIGNIFVWSCVMEPMKLDNQYFAKSRHQNPMIELGQCTSTMVDYDAQESDLVVEKAMNCDVTTTKLNIIMTRREIGLLILTTLRVTILGVMPRGLVGREGPQSVPGSILQSLGMIMAVGGLIRRILHHSNQPSGSSVWSAAAPRGLNPKVLVDHSDAGSVSSWFIAFPEPYSKASRESTFRALCRRSCRSLPACRACGGAKETDAALLRTPGDGKIGRRSGGRL
ncbi:hypothetical protein EJ05DRAFT_538367 [Pseudovirgaria hyperparasitica]|uniref:Uncharacterized protein n=1 Tax=Pseudovirgaria hyperparasitica TaxID=470096 RepID=A0A6A6WAI7_9PEZI|nr:uncharacterized protein EJ05DRAFT_538367 [Pseudovirgaria hyperparasitica]KAF2758131.1 hypothetical protein EJ05DRAFT_538367 [Pseudovirgaria hyperparasitica]